MKKISARFVFLIMLLTMLMSALGVAASAATTYTDPELSGEEWHKILVNPWNKKPSGYSIKLSYVRGYQVDSRCASQLKKMLSACEKAGHEPLLISGYRTNSTQEFIYNRNVQQYVGWGYSYSEAKKKAAKSTAVPGTSEHQIGLAVDIVDMDYQALVNSQANTNTQKWLMKNCWKYGFILRYPKGTTSITGIIYEPWHYRYVGKTVAKEIHEAGITLEEYLGAVQPKNVSISNNAGSGLPVLKWDKVENATKYSIYRSTSKNGTYKRIYTTKYLQYTDKKAEVGTKYYYYVKAVTPYGDYSKPSSKVVRTCDLPRPVFSIGNAPATGKIKLTWEPIEGAVKYEIYRSDSKNGTYTKIYTTKKTSFTNGSPKPGEAYYYRVKAIAKNTAANSALSVKKWRTCDLPRVSFNSIGNDASTGKVKFTWKAVNGAAKYKVYRSETADGTYKLIATVSGTAYTDTKGIYGKAYYYKVKAIAENTAANSALSAYRWRTCDLPAAAATVALSEENTPVVSWASVEGAVKYRVYRADSEDGEYKSVYSGSDCSFTDTSASGTVWYKVKVFAQNSSANSAYSEAVTITVPDIQADESEPETPENPEEPSYLVA